MKDAAAPQDRAPRPLRTVAILPARLASQRLPRKMLLAETGTPLIVHTAENVSRSDAIGRVVVATDSDEIRAAVDAAGIEVVMTSSAHPSGTDRVLEALRAVQADPAYEVVVNVQGDEPDLLPSDLERLVALFGDDEVQAATLCGRIASEEEAREPSVVKVVRDARGDALYFSRAPIPTRDHARDGAGGLELLARHIGVYAFRPAALEHFCALPVSPLEAVESLEQLRWLEAGQRMRVAPVEHVPRGIDTRRDYEDFVARCAAAEVVHNTEDR